MSSKIKASVTKFWKEMAKKAKIKENISNDQTKLAEAKRERRRQKRLSEKSNASKA